MRDASSCQQSMWMRREERMRKIVAAWEERALQKKEEVVWPPVANKATDVEISNGRLNGLIEYCLQRTSDLFWVVDLGCVEKLYHEFRRALPRVDPMYAVKCCPDPKLIHKLHSLGCGFDCASRKEIELAWSVGSSDIICANPCKRPEDLCVTLTTFDSICELAKLRNCTPLLRIRADDESSRLRFGSKYGAWPEEVEGLLKEASTLGIHVAGIAFHVGSGARNANAYKAAIAAARRAFRPGMTVLDIGGGFCGHFDDDGNARLTAAGAPLAAVINQALEQYFPQSEFPSLRVIAEPGRYFAESAATLCSRVVGVRQRGDHRDVWITDGVYGAFNAIIYDAWLPCAVNATRRGTFNGTTSVFGPTCDSLDLVFNRVQNAPAIHLGDLLLFPNCGAYTLAGATDFNGIPATPSSGVPIFYVHSSTMRATNEDKNLNILYSDKPPMELQRYFD